MTKEELDRQQEEETQDTSKLDDGSESEETSEDFKSLFEESEEDSQEDDPIKRLEKKYDSLEKGIRKYFSEKGIEKKSQEKQETETTSPVKRDRLAEEVLISKIPELAQSENAMQSIRTIAERTGQDIFTVVDQNEWIVEKAQAEAKRTANQSKLSSPSGKVREDLDKKLEITAEDRRISERFFGVDMKRYLKHKQSK